MGGGYCNKCQDGLVHAVAGRAGGHRCRSVVSSSCQEVELHHGGFVLLTLIVIGISFPPGLGAD